MTTKRLPLLEGNISEFRGLKADSKRVKPQKGAKDAKSCERSNYLRYLEVQNQVFPNCALKKICISYALLFVCSFWQFYSKYESQYDLYFL